MKLLVTGGSGFIGSTFIKSMLKSSDISSILNIDLLSYASNTSLDNSLNSKKYSFSRIDITKYDDLWEVMQSFLPDRIMHFAAESHVDRSISGAKNFIDTNILGTYNLLELSRELLNKGLLPKNFIFHHVSTDEVYGDLSPSDQPFTELSQYKPSSPYSASKAASDHLVRSWGRTYDLNYIITNCSNNFGPFQHPEKFIPTVILRAIDKKNIPIYGDGSQIRDWLFVNDHVAALKMIAESNLINEVFNIGSSNEITNKDLSQMILNIMIEDFGFNKTIRELVCHVTDRLGHDRRYSINSAKIKETIGWNPKAEFTEDLKLTVQWYIDNHSNIHKVFNGI